MQSNQGSVFGALGSARLVLFKLVVVPGTLSLAVTQHNPLATMTAAGMGVFGGGTSSNEYELFDLWRLAQTPPQCFTGDGPCMRSAHRKVLLVPSVTSRMP